MKLVAYSIGKLDESWWPKAMFADDTNDVDGDVNPRRRLKEDKWANEEQEMKQEIAKFFKDVKGSTSKGPNTLRSPQVKHKGKVKHKGDRLLQTAPLPPISVNCTDPTSTTLPCPNPNLPQICDKYNSGDFQECFEECKISFCCTHDSKSANGAQSVSPSCAETEPNCKNYIPCYIVWWKLSDTVGPATFLRLPGSRSSFFDITLDEIFIDINDIANAPFYEAYFGHYTDDDQVLDDLDFVASSNWVSVFNGEGVTKQ